MGTSRSFISLIKILSLATAVGLSACAEVHRSGDADSKAPTGNGSNLPPGNHGGPSNPNSPGGSPQQPGGGSPSGAGGSTGSGAGGASAGPPPGTTAPPASPPVGGADAGASATPDTAPSNTGDKYVPPGTNPFVIAQHDPFSTFGVDVDTASYDIFRRDINFGLLPRPESVRLEEYVNAFKYAYPAPAPDDAQPFRVSVAAAGQVFDRPTVLFRVGIKGKSPLPAERRRANLVFLIDTSGSMAGPHRLGLVQKTLHEALEFLNPDDRVSIVTYSAETTVRLAPTPIAERGRITTIIDRLVATGGTNGADGLGLAYQQAAAGFIEGGINHVVLCTDGDFNIGPSSTRELVDVIRSKRKTGVTLTVLGYGIDNLNDDLMESVANAGNGIYGVISSEEQMRRYVRERLLSTLIHIAKDVKIQVEFNPTKVHAYRLLGYENRAIADGNFRNDVIDAGEIGAGHTVTALYELVLAGGQIPPRTGAPAPQDGTPSSLPREIQTTDLALVKVRWKGVDATDATPALEMNTRLGGDEILESLGIADADMQFAAAVASLAETLKKSPYADLTHWEAMKTIIINQSALDEDRKELATLLHKAGALLPPR